MARKKLSKWEVREKYKDQIYNADRNSKVSAIRTILSSFTHTEEYSNSEVIALYWPKNTEFDVIPIIDFALFNKRKVVLPFIDEKDKMTFKEIDSIEFKRTKFKGIEQPLEEAKTYAREDIDIFVVPSIAFNKKGYRVGSGKGFYDRYLEGEIEATVFSLGQHDRLQEFETDIHDVPAKIIITERTTIRFDESGYELNSDDELLIPTLEIEVDLEKFEKEKAEESIAKDFEDFDVKDKTEEIEIKEDDQDEETNKKSAIITSFKKKDTEKNSIAATLKATGTSFKEERKKRKEEAKLAKKHQKDEQRLAKEQAKEVLDDNVEDDLREKLASDDAKKKKKKDDLSDIPDAEKLLAILEGRDSKEKPEPKEKAPKKVKAKKVKAKKVKAKKEKAKKK